MPAPAPFIETARPIQHYQVLKNLGDCHAALGHYDQAAGCYAQAAGLEPTFTGHQVGQGALALLQGNPLEAIPFFESARAADGRCFEAWWGLAMAHQAKGLHADAKKLYSQCLKIEPDNGAALLGLYYSCRQCGDFSGLEPPLAAYLDKHPGDSDALLCRADLQRRWGKLQDAQGTLATVLALDPQNAVAQRMLGKTQ